MKPGKKLPSIPRVSEPKDLLEPVVCCPKDQYLIAPPGHEPACVSTFFETTGPSDLETIHAVAF